MRTDTRKGKLSVPNFNKPLMRLVSLTSKLRILHQPTFMTQQGISKGTKQGRGIGKMFMTASGLKADFGWADEEFGSTNEMPTRPHLKLCTKPLLVSITPLEQEKKHNNIILKTITASQYDYFPSRVTTMPFIYYFRYAEQLKQKAQLSEKKPRKVQKRLILRGNEGKKKEKEKGIKVFCPLILTARNKSKTDL